VLSLNFPKDGAGAFSAENSVQICRDGLKRNIERVHHAGRDFDLLLTGALHYRVLWIRDFCMSVPGALAAGLDGVVRDTIDLIFQMQRADGLIPRLVDSKKLRFVTRFFVNLAGISPKFEGPLEASYLSEHGVISIDGNALLVWAATRYVEKTGDHDAAERWWAPAKKAIAFLEENHGVDGLIGKQPPFADWKDSVGRTGRVSFVNTWYVITLREFSRMGRRIGKLEAGLYEGKHDVALKNYRSFFWDENRRTIKNFEDDSRLVADANLLAITYGLVSRSEGESILERMKRTPLWSPIPGRATWPNYHAGMKSWTTRFAGIADYHDELFWLWLTAIAGRAELAVGNQEAGEQILEHTLRLVSQWGGVYEVYQACREPDVHFNPQQLRPVWRLLCRAEMPFTWSSAMIIELHAHAVAARKPLGLAALA
jgi:glycogen debranching enzyme